MYICNCQKSQTITLLELRVAYMQLLTVKVINLNPHFIRSYLSPSKLPNPIPIVLIN